MTLAIYHTLSDHTTIQPVALIDDSETLLTFAEALHLLKVSRSTLYRLKDRGLLRGYKIGNGATWRFRKADLLACLQEQ